ncbi:MAG: hypothetical protein JXB34_11015 [Bacteroidales bacterium]|nr:hypothetical protein [Bacteroidales bacterium]
MGINTFRIEVAGLSRSVSINVLKPEIIDGFWSDMNTKAKINEAFFGDKVKFTVSTKDIQDNVTLKFSLYDYDGEINPDDELDNTFKANVKNNIAELELTLKDKWFEASKYEPDKTIETYFKITTDIKGRKIEKELPLKKEDFLKIFEREVKITIIIELPHSKETGWGAKGLAGHTAMAIGDNFYDYGPDYRTRTVDEKKYDYDFNKDGDKNDIVNLSLRDVSYKFSPGRPWWGEVIADYYGISANSVTLNQILSFISLPWDQNNVYGEVKKIEFYVTEEQSKKMKDWWENRYAHLKAYSVYPWTGEQCTTTVKTALQAGGIFIPDATQKPSGILSDIEIGVRSTTAKHLNEKPTITTIKPESIDWNP